MQTKQFRDPETGGTVYATGDDVVSQLRDLGYTELGVAETETEDNERDAAIHGDLLVKDYEAATAENIVTLLGAADSEYATAVLAYEQAHKDRVTVTRAAEARVQELKAAGENG